MGVARIRTAAAGIVRGVGGINEVLAYPPESVGSLPVAWFGNAVATVRMGASESWTWDLPLTVAVARKAVYAMEAAATEALIDGLMAAIRANYTLGGESNGLNLVELREGVVNIANTDLVGFTMRFMVKEKHAVTLEG